MSVFECQECGHKYRKIREAQKARESGCPKCGSIDVDFSSPAVARLHERMEAISKSGPTPECINLDAMSPRELLQIADAKTLVPYQRLYAHCKYVAIELRLAGAIQIALLAERVCDSIYYLLPIELRWQDAMRTSRNDCN